eukprot:4449742-Karenia_brevis.AAC.1
MGPTPFVEDHVQVQQGEQKFLKSATIGTYQILETMSFKLWVSVQLKILNASRGRDTIQTTLNEWHGMMMFSDLNP